MLKKSVLWAAVLALLVVVPQAFAGSKEWTINLSGGMAAPMSDFKDNVKTGYVFGVGADYGLKENLALGIDGSFLSNSATDDQQTALSGLAGTSVSAKAEILQGGAHLKYIFPMASESKISPYVIGGAGVYNVKNKIESSNTVFNDAAKSSDSKFGARGGLGLMYKTSPKVGIGVESDYNWIDTSDNTTGAKSTQYVGVRAAVSIGMGTPAAK
jgi:opacity protein-like surface antigen